MVGYKKEGINLTTRYTLEYVDNSKDWDIIASGNIISIEPWEYYKKREYNNIDDAMSIFMIYLVRIDIYDVKLFEETILDGEIIQERYIEPNSTTVYSIKTSVEKSLYDNNRSLINENESLKNNNELYNAFIKKYNVEKMFHEFIKIYENEVKTA